MRLEKYVYEIDLWVKIGSIINSFTGANASCGTVILRFDTEHQIPDFINNIDKYIKLTLK